MPRTKAKPTKPANAALPTAVSPPPSGERDEVLTLAEAAAYLRVGEGEVLQAVRDQGLPARQLGADWRFLQSALQEWLKTPSRRNQGLLAHLGAARNDPHLEELLEEVYQRRGRPETEAG
jgi:excisionase family DNA binding protein